MLQPAAPGRAFGARHSQCPTPYRLVYILYILYMLKSTGIKILNVYIQTGVLLSVAYPFFLLRFRRRGYRALNGQVWASCCSARIVSERFLVPRQPLDCKRGINSSGGVQSLYRLSVRLPWPGLYWAYNGSGCVDNRKPQRVTRIVKTVSAVFLCLPPVS